MRIDRIDRLQDNIHLLIDYKTSFQLPDYQHWFELRPTLPQIPLYSLIQPTMIISCAFMQFMPYQLAKFNGLSEKELNISGIRQVSSVVFKNDTIRSWSQLIKFWQSTLNKIAVQF